MPHRFRTFLGVPSLLALAVAGLRMWQLNQQQELWGYWPLPLLLGAWGLIVALRQNTSRLRYLALATVAGVGLGLGFPPLPTWPLMVVGFVALLRLVDGLVEGQQARKRMWWYGYHAFVLYNVLATWWVANTALAAGIVANFLNALLMTVPAVAIYQARKHIPKYWLLAAPLFWISFEYLHYNWQIAWPWLTFGNALASTPYLAQWYEWTGVFGGSLYLAGGASLSYYVYLHLWRQPAGKYRAVIGLCAWWLVPVAVSLSLLVQVVDDGSNISAEVLAVQPNLEPHYEKFDGDPNGQLDHFFDLIGDPNERALVILPETSFGNYDEATLNRSPLFQRWQRDVASEVDLLAGLSTYVRYARPIESPALRTQDIPGGGQVYYTSHNSAVAATDSEVAGVYHKSRLVPGVEMLPYRKLLFFFEPLVKSLGGTTAGLGVSDSAIVFRYPSGLAAAPLICYESIYGDYVREFTQAGANLLVVPTNDGWWDDTPGHVQHLQIGQLRAIENRRWLVQAANSGISAIVDHAGQVRERTSYNEATVLAGEVKLLRGLTLYARVGDVLGAVCAGLGCLCLLVLLFVAGQRSVSLNEEAGVSVSDRRRPS